MCFWETTVSPREMVCEVQGRRKLDTFQENRQCSLFTCYEQRGGRRLVVGQNWRGE